MTDADALTKWCRMGVNISAVESRRPRFTSGISKEKMKFTNAAENNFGTEIFRTVKFMDTLPRAFYEREGLNGTPIDGQFYQKEMTNVRIASRTSKIDKIEDKRVGQGIRGYLGVWLGYSRDFES